MPTPVRFTHAAIRDLRYLIDEQRERIRGILIAICAGEGRTKRLAGFGGYFRSRSHNLRVIWRRADDGSILVARARVRAEAYRGRDWSERAADEVQHEALTAGLAQSGESDDIATIPADESAAYAAADWNSSVGFRVFLHGGFRHSPHLTPTQLGVAKELLEFLSESNGSELVTLVQGGPGTGKTVACALIACELLLRDDRSRAYLLVPELIVDTLLSLLEVREFMQLCPNRLVIETFGSFISRFSGTRLSTVEQELQILRNCKTRRFGVDFSEHDVALYRSFVLANDLSSPSRNALHQQHRTRIEALKTVPTEWFGEQLRALGLISPPEAARKLAQNPPASPASGAPVFLFVDELQDRTLTELRFLGELRRFWTARSSPTVLALMGDTNQRVMPTDFQWQSLAHALQISQAGRHSWSKNLRSTRAIASVASAFWRRSQRLISELDARHLPDPVDPMACEEYGDPVSLVCVADTVEAKSLLQAAVRKGGSHEYLRQDVASVGCVVWPGDAPTSDLPGLRCYYGATAKGLEFDDCAVVIDIDPGRKPSLEELNQIYMALTRPRHGLLVVLTSRSPSWVYEALVDAGAVARSDHAALSKLRHGGVAVDLTAMRAELMGKLNSGTSIGLPYVDSYELLRELGASVGEWETAFVASHSKPDIREGEALSARLLAGDVSVSNTDRLRLQVLLQRLSRDLEAATMTLRTARNGVFGNAEPSPDGWESTLLELAEGVAGDWELRGRNLAAARLGAEFGVGWRDEVFPDIRREAGAAASDEHWLLRAASSLLSRQHENRREGDLGKI